MAIYTVGHSTYPIDDFLALLRAHEVRSLVDVRTIPGSRRHPQFAQQQLASVLEDEGITYLHLPSLGGLRKPASDSTNLGWKNPGFRAYADHMATEEFEVGLQQLVRLADERPVAVMCAEALPWKCHRSLLSDALVARGIAVLHIMSTEQVKAHRLTAFARVEGMQVSYPGELKLDL